MFYSMPIILFNKNFHFTSESYEVPGNWNLVENLLIDYFFLFIIKSVFKKVQVNRLFKVRKNLKSRLIKKKFYKKKYGFKKK
jgi:hypothetical protein